MPNPPTRPVGSPLNLERLSGRLFFMYETESAYRDLGDVIMHKFSPDTKTVEASWHTRGATEKQARLDSQSSTLEWDLEFQEHTIENDALIMQGKVGAGFSQAAVNAGTQTLHAVQLDRWYDLGVLSLLTLGATVAEAAKTTAALVEDQVTTGVDAIFDQQLGMVMFLSTGTIAAAADVDLTFTAAAVAMATVDEVGMHPISRGIFRLASFDGETAPARNLIEFAGQITRDDPGQNGTDKFNSFKFKLTATNKPKVRLGVPAAA